jgi:CRISPR/Cas system-associated exonuclease Cas4 (RecB family)
MNSTLKALTASGPRQARPGDYVSPSRLNLWLRCPLAFKLKYVDGVEVPTSPALLLGQVVHKLLEHYYRHRMRGHSLGAVEVSGHLTAIWAPSVEKANIAFESSAQEERVQCQAVDLVTAYLAQITGDEPAPVAVESVMEAPIVDANTGEDLGISLVGITDLLVEEAEGPLIVDFKTAARSTLLEISHEIQLTCYALLVRHIFGQEESGLEIRSLIKTKIPQVKVHAYPTRTDDHFRRLLAAIRAYLENLDSGRYVFRPGLGCSVCDYRDDHCRRWGG